MKGFLRSGAALLGILGVVTAIGLTIEWNRRRSIQGWVQEQGGTFESGGILTGIPVPEAAPFDSPTADVGYSNVSRITRPEASYVVAQYRISWKDLQNKVESFSCVVCFVTMPGTRFPPVQVAVPTRGSLLALKPGRPAPPVPIPVPDSSAAFAAKFEVTPQKDAGEVRSETLVGLLPKAVQDELVASDTLLSGLETRGGVVRVQAIRRQSGYPHKEVFDVAVRLAAAWSAKR